MKCTLVRVDNGQPFVADAAIVKNDDGSVSLQLPNGTGWAGQEPNVYGLRHDQPANEVPGAYQRFTLNGSNIVSVTRPQDVPFIYLFGQGQAY